MTSSDYPPIGRMLSERAFREEADARAARFNAYYGVRGAWSDEQLDRALSEHGMPPLSAMPDGPRGMMVRNGAREPISTAGRHRWRRTNAAHLLGHVMLHGGNRCDGCRDWGKQEGNETS